MLRTVLLFLLLIALLPLRAQKGQQHHADKLPYSIEDGSVRISNGYALVLTKDGRGVAYDPDKYAILEMDYKIYVLSAEQYAALWKELARLRCGCEPGQTCVNGRCYKMLVPGDIKPICYPRCEGGYVCINGRCIERPFDPGQKGQIFVNGQLLKATIKLPRLPRATGKKVAIFKLP